MSEGLHLAAEGLDGAAARVEALVARMVARLRRLALAAAEHEARALAGHTPRAPGPGPHAADSWGARATDDGAEVLSTVLHTQFLLEGTGTRRAAGVVNPSWPGMAPNADLRRAYLDAPGDLEAWVGQHMIEYLL